jgi:hypothetical protein
MSFRFGAHAQFVLALWLDAARVTRLEAAVEQDLAAARLEARLSRPAPSTAAALKKLVRQVERAQRRRT